jgi:hypothetical protein
MTGFVHPARAYELRSHAALPVTAASFLQNCFCEWSRLLVAIAIALTLSSCTSLAGTARVDGPPHAGLAFEGLISQDAGRARVRYIFQTHGINSPCCGWAQPLLNAIADPRYGFVKDYAASYPWRKAALAQPMIVTGRDASCARPEGCRLTTFGQYSKDVFVNRAAGEKVVVFSYAWRDDLWSITCPHVCPDIRANTYSFPSTKHSYINARLKIGVMDEGLSDAVGYLSSLGALEREGMETAVCAMLLDAAAVRGPSPGAGCLGRFEATDLDRLDQVEFNFLSHSLGSRMLYDVLSNSMPSAGVLATKSGMNVRGAIRARTHELIMAANQMPLLAPSEFHVTPESDIMTSQVAAALAPPSSADAFINMKPPAALNTHTFTSPILHLTVVAFQDPDDLLGFKASDAAIGAKDPNVTFVDVLHRNADQWLFVFASPYSAHDHELEERHSLKMILCGADESTDGRLAARTCGKLRGATNG